MAIVFGRRRLLLQGGLAGLGALAAPALRAAEHCGITPRQIEGPFFPVAPPADQDLDLTRVAGHVQAAEGQVVVVAGQVRGPDCAPLAGALLDVWQACASGRYNHPQDDSTAPLDPHFQYSGRLVADAEGRYRFKTIKPGAYDFGRGSRRTPHIHFKVAAAGYGTLITQMYFEGESLNATDAILGNLGATDRRLLIVPFETSADGAKGTFDVVLGGRRSARGTPFLD